MCPATEQKAYEKVDKILGPMKKSMNNVLGYRTEGLWKSWNFRAYEKLDKILQLFNYVNLSQ